MIKSINQYSTSFIQSTSIRLIVLAGRDTRRLKFAGRVSSITLKPSIEKHTRLKKERRQERKEEEESKKKRKGKDRAFACSSVATSRATESTSRATTSSTIINAR